MENFQEFLAFNAFIYDESRCQYGKKNFTNYKVTARNWKVACDNYYLMKYLLVNDKVNFDELYSRQDNYCIGSFDLMLQVMGREIDGYDEKVLTNFESEIMDSSGGGTCQPATLVQLAAVTLAEQNSLTVDYSRPRSYAQCIEDERSPYCGYHVLK